MSDFVHLHLHTEYSLLDGATRINELMKHVKSIGQSAVAITDHGVMYGVIDFYEAAKKYNVKPIIGCEVYLSRRTRFDKVSGLDDRSHHLVLLCKNEIGYKNLMKLVSKGFVDGFYYRPRVDKELLKEHSEGLVCLSACLAGEIPRLIEIGDYNGAKEAALWYRDIFGRENFYLEVQDHDINLQKSLNKILIRLSNETGIPLVATNDCHYLKKEDSELQNVLMCIQTNSTIDDDNNMEFPTNEFYVKSKDEMLERFSGEEYVQAIENTNKIADMCNLEIKFYERKLPNFDLPDGTDHVDYFKELCYSGLKKRYGKNLEENLLTRIEYEIDTIINSGFVDYFLIVSDFVSYAKSMDIPVGPGRGSGAGSLCAYAMEITDIDPIKYGLLFERFLNPERISMPDFDIDFCYERRQEVIDYVIKKYGKNHVAQIISFGTLAARAAIRDVGRAMGISYSEVDKMAKSIPYEPKITLEKAYDKSKELRTFVNSGEKNKQLFNTAVRLEGVPRHASTHAAGVIITSDDVDNHVPLALNDEAVVTQFSMDILEKLGLLKMDFLGLRTLTLLKNTETMVNEHAPDFREKNIPLDDKRVYEMLSKGGTEGVFQFESDGMTSVLERLKPEYFEDLIAVISLYRPGPMDSIPIYIRNRHNPQMAEYKHPLLESILKETYGVIVYQEQVMEIFRTLAGYSYARADLVRRAMSHKESEVMENERQYFINGHEEENIVGCVANGVPKNIANAVFNEMSSFASYAFNKAHATCYALLSYKTAYLKVNYTIEYMSALLSSVQDSSGSLTSYINECTKAKINVLPPDINESNKGFTPANGNIRFGLLAIKNLGLKFIEKMIEERNENGKFISLYDLCKRMAGEGLNKRTIESLIKAGAMDGLSHNRRTLLLNLEKIISFVLEESKNASSGQVSLFDGKNAEVHENVLELEEVEEFSIFNKLTYEKEILGFYVSGHPLDKYIEIKNSKNIDKIIDISPADEMGKPKFKDNQRISIFCVINKVNSVMTKKNQGMAFIDLEDETGTIEGIVFPTVFDNYFELIKRDKMLLIKGKINIKDDEAKIICEEIILPEKLGKDEKKNSNVELKLYLKVPSHNSKDFSLVKEILSKYSGDIKVLVYFDDKKTLTEAPENLYINPNDDLIIGLKKILGEKNVVMK